MNNRKIFVMRNEVSDLENLTREELRNYLSIYGVNNTSGLSKDELIEKVLDTNRVNVFFGEHNTTEKRVNKLVDLFDEKYKVCKEKDGVMYEYYYIDKDLMNEYEGYGFEDGELELNFDLRNIIEKYQDYVYELGLDVYIDNDVKVYIYDNDDDLEIEDGSCGDRIDMCFYIPTSIQEVKDCVDKMMTKDHTIILEGYYGLKRFVEEEVKSYLNAYEDHWEEEAECQNEINKNTITLEHASARINCDGVLVIKNNKNEVVKCFDGYNKDEYFSFDDIKIEINNLYGEISMKNYEKFFAHRHAETKFEKMGNEEFTKLKGLYDEK